MHGTCSDGYALIFILCILFEFCYNSRSDDSKIILYGAWRNSGQRQALTPCMAGTAIPMVDDSYTAHNPAEQEITVLLKGERQFLSV